jgi:hypothetical protein
LKKRVYRRNWLNPKEGRAFIETATELVQYSKEDPVNFDANLSLADCSRTIHLEFSAYNKEDVWERVAKLNILQKHLGILKDELMNALKMLPTKKQEEEMRKARAAKRKAQPTTTIFADL